VKQQKKQELMLLLQVEDKFLQVKAASKAEIELALIDMTKVMPQMLEY
jgi:hypothetical protein